MTANKHTPFLSNEQVQALNEKHGWFKHGDAQSDVSRAFANDAVAAYERVRAAAPDLLAALERIASPHDCGCVPCTGQCRSQIALEIAVEEMQGLARAAIAKVGGAA